MICLPVPNRSIIAPRRSGLTGIGAAASPSLLSKESRGAASARDGAALIRPLPPEVDAAAALLRLRAEGMNAVLSFLKSRSSGAADIVDGPANEAAIAVAGLGGRLKLWGKGALGVLDW